MSSMTRVRRMTVEAAIEDLQQHTLGGISGEIAQLVYLASTRDYNTGQYYHDGLAFRYGEEIARTALARHHENIFRELVFSSLEDLVQKLDAYMQSARVAPAQFLELWKKVQPYRITVPIECDSLSVELFLSNIKVALAILQARYEARQGS